MNKHTGIDIEGVGRRMPYRIAPGTFESIEQGVLAGVSLSCRKPWYRRWQTVAAAASVAVMVAAGAAVMMWQNGLETAGTEIAQADVHEVFGQLSADNQEALLALYEQDVFINE